MDGPWFARANAVAAFSTTRVHTMGSFSALSRLCTSFRVNLANWNMYVAPRIALSRCAWGTRGMNHPHNEGRHIHLSDAAFVNGWYPFKMPYTLQKCLRWWLEPRSPPCLKIQEKIAWIYKTKQRLYDSGRIEHPRTSQHSMLRTCWRFSQASNTHANLRISVYSALHMIYSA